jgi:SAM-dependent methyltransferase
MGRGSWRSDDYAEAWAADDVLDELLGEPRRLTAALVAAAGTEVAHVVDLGAGTGPYLGALLEAFPAARGTWVDVSERMRDLARDRLGGKVRYVVGDVAEVGSLGLDPAQVVVTSRVVHDLPPEMHQSFYESVLALLEPGGFFFNLDHVAVPPDWQARYGKVRERRKEPLPPHRDYPLVPIREHLARIEAAGFDPPDVPWRTFGTALLAARRPA